MRHSSCCQTNCSAYSVVMNFVTGELSCRLLHDAHFGTPLSCISKVLSTVQNFCGSDMSPNNPRKWGPNNYDRSSSFSDKGCTDHKHPARTCPPTSETPHKAKNHYSVLLCFADVEPVDRPGAQSFPSLEPRSRPQVSYLVSLRVVPARLGPPLPSSKFKHPFKVFADSCS